MQLFLFFWQHHLHRDLRFLKHKESDRRGATLNAKRKDITERISGLSLLRAVALDLMVVNSKVVSIQNTMATLEEIVTIRKGLTTRVWGSRLD